LVGEPERKRPLGKPRRRWDDNIKMDLQEVGCGNMDWIKLALDRDRWRLFICMKFFHLTVLASNVSESVVERAVVCCTVRD